MSTFFTVVMKAVKQFNIVEIQYSLISGYQVARNWQYYYGSCDNYFLIRRNAASVQNNQAATCVLTSLRFFCFVLFQSCTWSCCLTTLFTWSHSDNALYFCTSTLRRGTLCFSGFWLVVFDYNYLNCFYK